jgi:hypothetical protein
VFAWPSGLLREGGAVTPRGSTFQGCAIIGIIPIKENIIVIHLGLFIYLIGLTRKITLNVGNSKKKFKLPL